MRMQHLNYQKRYKIKVIKNNLAKGGGLCCMQNNILCTLKYDTFIKLE